MTISNTQDVIDSRDVIERIEDLRSQLEAEFEQKREDDDDFAQQYNDDEFITWLDAHVEGNDPDVDELNALEALRDEAEPYAGDWEYGTTLINRDYWVEYVEDFVKDCGFIPHDLPAFIANNIDWENVAKEVEQDYTTVNFDGQEFLVR